MLASLRGLPDFVRAQEEGRWVPAEHLALADRTVLLVGYGSMDRPSNVDSTVSRRMCCGWPAAPGTASRTWTPFLTCCRGRRGRPAAADDRRHARPGRRGLSQPQCMAARSWSTSRVDRSSARPRCSPSWSLAGCAPRSTSPTRNRCLRVIHCGRHLGCCSRRSVGGNTSAFLPRAYRLLSAQLRGFAAGDPLENVVTGDY